MLKFDYQPVLRLHIRDVLFAVFGPVDNLLPVDRKLILPTAVPFSLRLPPAVAGASRAVGPMPDPVFSAFRHHSATATWAFPRQTRLGFSALSVN